jgi:glyoxylase-like metal-dependent hydrolase (beta-lactamase superfamily II)
MQIQQIKLSFSNAYLVQDQRVIVVDSGMPGDAPKILAAASRLGLQPQDFSLILHTHGHADHAGSSAELKEYLGVPTLIHAADAEMLRRGRMRPLNPQRLEARLIRPLVNRPFPPFEPDLVIQNEMDLDEFGVRGRIILTPGHTTGSISILLPNGEALIGDLLMGGWLGGSLFGSHPNEHYFAEDLEAARTSLANLLQEQPDKVYVGHGGPLEAETVNEKFFRKSIQKGETYV